MHQALGHPDRAASAAVPLSALRWPKDLAAWRGRVAWLAAHAPQLGLPDLNDAALVATADAWLAPHLARVRTKAQLQAIELAPILRCRAAVLSSMERTFACYAGGALTQRHVLNHCLTLHLPC